MATRYGTSWPLVMATTLFHPGEGTNTFLESYYVSIFLIKPEFVFRISVSLLENMSKVAVTGTVAITGQGRAGYPTQEVDAQWRACGLWACCGTCPRHRASCLAPHRGDSAVLHAQPGPGPGPGPGLQIGL